MRIPDQVQILFKRKAHIFNVEKSNEDLIHVSDKCDVRPDEISHNDIPTDKI